MLLKKYNLADWFAGTFSENEKNILISACPDFTDQGAVFNSSSAAYFLANSLMWYNKKDNSDICQKVIEKIEALLEIEKDININDLFFIYSHLIGTCYKLRDIPGYMEKTILYCNRQIEIAPRAVSTFGPFPPEPVGFKQLCIIEKKNKNWSRVVELCQAAMSQGWGGDWAARLAEAEKKL